MIANPSPNFDERKGCEKPSLVILHYTGMKTGAEALARLCDAAAKVSAHYVVEEDGRVFKLVDEDKRAWHAGKSFWRGVEDINSHSIGIEIVNPGHEFGYRAFPHMQMQAVQGLCAEIKARYGLLPQAFLGHSDIAPLRKDDPGELFDWKFLAKKNIGIWPNEDTAPPQNLGVDEAAKMLSEIGYGYITENFSKVLLAFQRHYVPEKPTGRIDELTARRLIALHQMCKFI